MLSYFKKRKGHQAVLALGAVLSGLVAAPMAIDVPMYYNVQQQLQTAIDAATLAGASKLPEGQTQARTEALRVLAMNPVQGKALTASDVNMTFSGSAMQITSQVNMPTLTSKITCSLLLTLPNEHEENEDDPNHTVNQVQVNNCSSLSVGAKSRAVPAARDTVLVIDTSSSMSDMGGGRPFSDVRSAAKAYIDEINSLNSESVDRIGLVNFDRTAALKQQLTSKIDSPNFSVVKTRIDGLSLYSGSGWNTNYEAGLKIALDELQTRGRQNSNKTVIFLTDGQPNLPAPAAYTSYNLYNPFNKCTDIVNNSTAVKAMCVRRNGQTTCPVLPSSQITDAMISQTAVDCGNTYMNFLNGQVNAQTARAKQMDVTIYTITIDDLNSPGNSDQLIRRILKQPTWTSSLLQTMASETKGQYYTASKYNAAEIKTVYQNVAKEIRVRLAAAQ